jgi:hypothetical protein
MTIENKTNKKIVAIILFCIFAISLILPALRLIPSVSADDAKLTIASLIGNFAEGSSNDQEITNTLGFTSDFGDVAGAPVDLEGAGWLPPTYDGISLEGEVTVQDLTADIVFGDTTLDTIGTDGIPGNKYGLFFKCNPTGIAGIESPNITIPAHALYVLTFNVKIVDIDKSYGINAKLIQNGTDKIVSMAAIKTENQSYSTYAFLIRGGEFESTSVRLRLLLGNINGTTQYKELGYAVVDTIRLFSVNNAQYKDLASSTTNTKADFFQGNPSYAKIPNGYFMYTDNQKWDLNASKLTDLRPSDWTQETVVTEENSRVAHYGIINTNQDLFDARKSFLSLDLINPNNPDGTSITTGHNNVLLIYNSSSTYQTIKSGDITLAKNSVFEISFKFNTPATNLNAEDEKNSLNFYIVDTDGKKIYSSEDMYSYTEHEGTNNQWATFRVFIKTSDTDKKVNFVIKFGTEGDTKEGYAYVDDVILLTKTESSLFENSQADTYKLKNEEGEDAEYLKEGVVSFADLKNLDFDEPVNRVFATYEYLASTADDDDDDDDDGEETPDQSNGTILWYIIPSTLLGASLILGLIVYYTKKFKIKKPKKKKKNPYDRRKTLEKQIEQREKNEKFASKVDIESELKSVRSQIEKLETEYEASKKIKSKKMALKSYISKREKLQSQETKLLEMLKKSIK